MFVIPIQTADNIITESQKKSSVDQRSYLHLSTTTNRINAVLFVFFFYINTPSLFLIRHLFFIVPKS